MWRVKEETPNIPYCSVLTWCQSKESFKHHYSRSNVELPLRLKARKQLLLIWSLGLTLLLVVLFILTMPWLAVITHPCHTKYPSINFPVY